MVDDRIYLRLVRAVEGLMIGIFEKVLLKSSGVFPSDRALVAR